MGGAIQFKADVKPEDAVMPPPFGGDAMDDALRAIARARFDRLAAAAMERRKAA